MLSVALAATFALAVTVAAPAFANEGGVISGTPSSMWQTNGSVRALAYANGKIFVGGEFTSTRPPGSAAGSNETARNYLAAYDSTTGALISSWNPAPNNKVWALTASPDGSKIYVGGDFTSIAGSSRTRVAMFSTSGTMAVSTTFKPSASYRVMKMAVSPATPNTLYLSGSFSLVNNVARSRAAAVDANNGTLLPFDPNVTSDPNAAVQTSPDVPAIAVTNDGTKVYLGGRFTTVHGVPNYAFAEVDPTTGEPGPASAQSAVPTPQNYCISGVRDIVVDNSTFYAGAAGDGGGCFDGTFAGNISDGSLKWRNTCLGATEQVILIKGWLYKGSHAHDCSSVNDFPQLANRFLLVENPSTGALGPWSPQTNAAGSTQVGPLAFATDGNQLFVGGDFTTVAGVGQQGVTRYGAAPSAPPSKPSTPTAFATGPGTVGLSFRGSYDVDDSTLTYQLFRSDSSSTPIKTWTMQSRFWDIPGNDYADTGLTVGAKYTYRVVVSDGLNTVSSDNSPQVTVASTVQPYSTVIKSDGATNYWRLNEASGTTANDSGRLTNPGTYNGGITLGQPGIAGDTAASFDGQGGTNVSTKNLTDVPGPQNFAAEAWIKTDTTTGGEIISFGNSQTGQSNSYDRQLYMTNDGRVVWGIYNNQISVIASSKSLNDGNWHHLVGTYRPGAQNFYVDGVSQGSLAPAFAQSVRGWWRIGGDNLNGWPAQPSSTNFKGTIDEAAIYDYALPGDAAARHFRAGGGNFVPAAAISANCNQLTCAFDGTGSSDSDGNIASYAWNFGDGATATGGTPSHSYATRGAYQVTLTVTDNAGAVNSVSKTVYAKLPAPTDHYGSVVTGDSPDIYWRLDESTGTTAADLGTSGNDGTYSGGVTLGRPGAVDGTSDTSALFNGGDGGIGATVAQDNPTTYSEEAWFKTTTTSGGKIIGFGSSSTGSSSHYDRHVYMTTDGRLNFGVYTGQLNVVTSDNAYNDDAWHHVVATQSAAGMVLYVDGQAVGTNPQTGQEYYTGYWRVGGDNSWSGNPYFAGQIDEAAFYSVALSSAQVSNHYKAGAGTPAPIANADTGSTGYNTALVVGAPGVLQNDTGTDLTVTSNTAPHHGTATVAADGSYRYVPATNYAGDDSFTYTATDSVGKTATATVSLTVVAPGAPMAIDDTAAVTFETALSVDAPGVLGNDAGTGKSVSAHTAPSHGALSINADGSYTYTPATGFAGSDSFTYTMSDSLNRTSTATVDISVSSPPAPTAADDSYQTPYRTPIQRIAPGVLVNDNGTRLSVTDHTAPLHGSLDIADDGAFTYTPAGGYAGNDSFTYTVTDALARTATATVSLTVTAPTAPVAADDSYTTAYQTPVNRPAPGVLSNDTGNGLTVTDHTSPANGTVSINGDGSFIYTPGNGFAGTDTFTYTATDVLTRTATATVTVTVTPPAAPVAGNDAVTTPYQTAVSAAAPGLLINDTGTGIAVSDHSSPAHGSLTISANGAYTYTPATGFSGTDSFTYTVSDSFSRTSTATVTVTVNAAPVLLLAQDSFSRTVAGGWGTATTGGAWGPNNAALSVNGSVGLVNLSAGNNRSSFLTTLGAVRDVNATETVSLDKLPSGSGIYSSISLRRPTATTVTEYRGTIRVQSTGKVTGLIYRASAGTDTIIGAETTITGLTATPNTEYSVRFSAVGASPTQLALTIWKTGTAEPAPQLKVSDSTAGLQVAGLVGVVHSLSSTSTVSPVVVSIDSFDARKPS